VLLAHPERSPCFLGDLDRMERVVDRGVLSSVTAGSMAGRFGKTVYDFTVRLFEPGLVHDVASDAHGVERRPPGLLAGFDRLDGGSSRPPRPSGLVHRTVPGAILGVRSFHPAPVPWPVAREGSVEWVASLRRRGG
jgi:protein-tyrosine phosphatase